MILSFVVSMISLQYSKAVVQRCSARIGVLRNFAKFTGKHLCQSLFFNIVAGRLQLYFQKRLWHRCFPVNFATFLRTPILTEHLWWLLFSIFCLCQWFTIPYAISKQRGGFLLTPEYSSLCMPIYTSEWWSRHKHFKSLTSFFFLNLRNFENKELSALSA